MTESTYFQQFISEYRVTPENNSIRATIRIPGEHPQKVDTQIFTEDKDGNIDILVYTLDYELIPVDHPNATPDKPNINNDRVSFYKVKRYAVPKEYMDKKTGETKIKKYDFPKGTGTHPFIPPAVAAKYHAKQKIKTLILTEGYKKAWYGALCGLDIIGLSSITHYKDKDTQAMYDDVLCIVNTCEVQNIILLHDGDCSDISLKALEQKTDLYTRPGGFFKAALQTRELFKSFNENLEFYFAHIRSEVHPDHPKGLDDLLLSFPGREPDIVADLTNYSNRSTYFFRENITFNPNLLVKHFAFNAPEIFYLRHADIIQNREFVYHGTSYVWNENDQKLIKIRLREANDYFRVGDTYYKFVKIPNKYGQLETSFQVRQKTTITDDFGKPFLLDVQKYEAFCNIPSHTEYNMIVHNCFNVYSEFSHEPEPGSCDASLAFVRHIFQEHYELGLDYIQLLYQKPNQILPILCLVSRENNTGKSTFVKWMKAIFTQNATVVGNDQFQDQFNASWATKLLITCEESFIEKKRVMEKIKQFSTGDKVPLRMMQKDPVEIDFFGKFILCSNNEERFIIAESQDHRFWVRKVPVPGTDNVKMLDTLIQEIPAFLDYLNKRNLSTTQESRMWFHHKLLITEAFRNLVEANKPTIEKELSEHLRNLFIESKEEIIYAPMNIIINRFLFGKKYDETYLKKTLTFMGIKQYTSENGSICLKRCSIPFIDQDGKVIYENCTGRPYIFERRKFISDSEFNVYSYDIED